MLSLSAAKSHLRVEFEDDDTYIGDLIASAVAACEDYTGRSFTLATISEDHLRTSDGVYWIDAAPVRSVLEILELDEEQVEGAAIEDFSLTVHNGEGRLVVDTDAYAVRLSISKGYDDDAPASIIAAVRFLLSDFYVNRSGEGDLPKAVKRLLDPYRVRTFAGA